ncbi:EF-hand domain-containing protein [Mesorhizobium sp.]|uniref:EF-hand domain-containing protein n=1 Tax=Mesorhizobium sp. TaxID=1871066 RepID=UPI0011F93B63|nr:EF-hand domain-containing protein [Mesorhizobium sp.]TIT00051.1 MAG: EF-hand domain-containing protein [Mesorhizobium sp.]
MTLISLTRVAALAAIVAAGVTATAAAQTTAADPHHMTVAQAAPSTEPGDMAGQDQGAQPAQPGMMPPGMMCQGMTGQGMTGQGMGQGMMGEMMQPSRMGAMPMMRMRGHMMKVMFAIADTDGDSALSFEEITAIHKRIFDKVDANKDGKVTTEEVQAFMRE